MEKDSLAYGTKVYVVNVHDYEEYVAHIASSLERAKKYMARNKQDAGRWGWYVQAVTVNHGGPVFEVPITFHEADGTDVPRTYPRTDH